MTVFKLLVVLLLVLGNGFFVAAEFALVAVRRSRVEQLVAEGRRSAIPVQRAVQNLDMYLAATQFGITLTSLALGWIGEPALAHLIEPAFHWLPASWGAATAHTVAIVVAFTIITALHIVLGELAPKSLALQRAEAVSLVVARPLELFMRIFRPAIMLLNALGNFVLKLFGLKAASEEHSVHTAEELRMLVESSAKEGSIGSEKSTFIGGVFRMGDQPVGALMTPRVEMEWLDITHEMPEIAARIAASKYSKLPVVEGSNDKIIGILQKGDFAVGGLPVSTDALRLKLRTPLYIPESAPALKVVETLHTARQDLAIVVNEFGGVEGVLTLQDILGAISFAKDKGPGNTAQRRRPDGSWLLNAMLPVDALRDAFGLQDLPDDGSYHTLGGFVLEQLGRVPRVGERFDYGGYRFEVTEMLGHRIVHVVVRPTAATVAAEAKAEAEAAENAAAAK